MSKEDYLDKALAWVKTKTVDTIKSIHPDYDDPKAFLNSRTKETIQADISFTSPGRKNFTEIALKSDNKQKLVTKWKLLSMMAAGKNGKLFLLAPKGHKMFTQRLVDQYNINATVRSI